MPSPGEGRAVIVDALSGAEIKVLEARQEETNVLHGGRACYSRDGTRILTTVLKTASTWDANTGELIAVLKGHSEIIWCASFFEERYFAVTGSDDRTARVWNAETGEELAKVTLDAAVTAVDAVRSYFALGDALGRIHVFDISNITGAARAMR
jgi:WD40 repeat protein